MPLKRNLHARLFCAALAAGLLFAFSPGASAQQAVGDARRVVNTVTGSGAVAQRRLATADPVFRAETIAAAPDSRGEIQLHDGSRLIVGENSSITMDDFVIAGNSVGRGTIRIAKGAFRFISGASDSNITFRTPLSTIGVRGTAFDVYVDEGITRAVVLNGRIQVCTLTRRCVISRRHCDVIEITGRDEIREAGYLRSRQRGRAQEAAMFPLTERQDRHSAGWRVPDVGCNARAAMDATQGRSGNVGGPGDHAGISISAPEPASSSDDNGGDNGGDGDNGEGDGNGGYGGGEGGW